jgi:hypothetical protein
MNVVGCGTGVLTGCTFENAAKSITDTFNDRGIDAIYFDPGTVRLIVVQSKWSDGISWRDTREFTDGVRKLITPDPDAFSKNPKIKVRRSEIQAALRSSARIVLVTVHHGPQPADQSALGRVNELAAQIDGGSGLAEAVHWHQKHILDAIQSESVPPAISADLYFSNWGEIKDPYHAVFGRVQGAAIAELGKNTHLAHQNLRERLQRTDVNVAIASTVKNEPQHFWYFNNGLTIICDSIRPAVLGRLNSTVALFHLEGISLVNGAQTTGMVSEHLDSLDDAEKEKLWIQVRAIAVKNCPDDFGKRVTRYTNLQNAVTLQDFVSLDPVQSRLSTDLAIQGRRYAFRSGGESEPAGDAGCTLKEATFALACAEPDLHVAVQGKREISVLWGDSTGFYRRMFHDNLTATRLWNAVVIMREANTVIADLGEGDLFKADMVESHMRWVLMYLVFQSTSLKGWDTAADPKTLLPEVQKVARDTFGRMCRTIKSKHANEYLASLSKNYEKCNELVGEMSAPSKQGVLFTDDDA